MAALPAVRVHIHLSSGVLRDAVCRAVLSHERREGSQMRTLDHSSSRSLRSAGLLADEMGWARQCRLWRGSQHFHITATKTCPRAIRPFRIVDPQGCWQTRWGWARRCRRWRWWRRWRSTRPATDRILSSHPRLSCLTGCVVSHWHPLMPSLSMQCKSHRYTKLTCPPYKQASQFGQWLPGARVVPITGCQRSASSCMKTHNHQTATASQQASGVRPVAAGDAGDAV